MSLSMEEVCQQYHEITGQTVGGFDEFESDFDIDNSETQTVLKNNKKGQTLRIYKKKQPEEQSILKIIQTSMDDIQKDIIKEFHKVIFMDHPNIVKYERAYFWSEKLDLMESKTAVIKMEPLKENVNQEIVRRKTEKDTFTDVEVLFRIKYLLDALQYLLSKNLNHMNLKPSNILLDEDGTPKLSDFGFTKERQRKSGSVTSVTVEAVSDYSSPEMKVAFLSRTEDEESIKLAMKPEKSDVYSLGMSLVRICDLGDEKKVKNCNEQNKEGLQATSSLIRRIPSKYLQNVFNNMLKQDNENRCNISQLLEIMRNGKSEIPRH